MTANENLRPGRDQKPLCRQGDTPVALVVLNLRGRLARLPGPRYSGCLLSRSGFVRRWAVGEAGRWCSVWQDAVDNLTVAEADIAARDTRLGFAEDDIDGLEALFVGVSRGLDEFTFLDTVVFSDMNLQVVNGNGPFFCGATPVYRLGNIIVGYNEPLNPGGFGNLADPPFAGAVMSTAGSKGASHNLVVGRQHSCASSAAIITGFNNVSDQGGNVIGSFSNMATGLRATVSGARRSVSEGTASSVSGGRRNWATGDSSSVSGGKQHRIRC